VRPDDGVERADERRDEQAHHTAIEPIRNARVVAFAEIKAETVVRHRVAEPREQFAAVSEDVAIMYRDHARLFAGQRVAETNPDVAPLAAGAGVQVVFRELAEERAHPRPVIP
jgi:hypothetical protein